MERDWVMGFLEANSSFAVNIGFKETKNLKSIVFKPYIVVAKIDPVQVSIIKNYIKLEFTKINIKTKSKKYHNDYHSLNIQNKKDIDKVIALIKGNEFKSQIKQKAFDTFVDCYDTIKEVGNYHHEWLDNFTDIIEKKLSINENHSNIKKNKLTQEQWEKRIKKHLS